MFGIGKPKDKKYYDDGAHSFGKRDKYTSLFSKPEEEYYFKSDGNALYHTYGFADGGRVKKAYGIGGWIGDLADPHTYGLEDGGRVKYPYPRYKLPVEEVMIQDHVAKEAFGIGGWIGDIGTAIFGNATYKVKKWLEAHGEEEIESVQIGRVPIAGAINTAMEILSLGEFSKAKKMYGYDSYFHLFLILNDKYRIEKNQNVNVIYPYSKLENEDRFNVSLNGLKGKTINDFIANGVERMGENDYWQNYDGLVMNCQNWVSQNLKANGVDSDGAEDFYWQNTEHLQDVIKPAVKEQVKEVTSLASGLDKFLSWISGGKWGLAKGGLVRNRIGRMK